MRSEGQAVSAVGSAEELLDVFSPASRACLVVDVHLPGMSGINLLQHLRARDISSPVIIISAYRDECLAKLARQAGAYAVVMKPFRGNELSRLIRRALDGEQSDDVG